MAQPSFLDVFYFLITTQAKRNLSSRSGIGGVRIDQSGDDVGQVEAPIEPVRTLVSSHFDKNLSAFTSSLLEGVPFHRRALACPGSGAAAPRRRFRSASEALDHGELHAQRVRRWSRPRRRKGSCPARRARACAALAAESSSWMNQRMGAVSLHHHLACGACAMRRPSCAASSPIPK